MKHAFNLHQDANDAWLEVPMTLFREHIDQMSIHYGSRMSANRAFLLVKPDEVNFLYLLARAEWVLLPKTGITSLHDFPNVNIIKTPWILKSAIRDLPPLTKSSVWPVRWESFERECEWNHPAKRLTPSSLREQLERPLSLS